MIISARSVMSDIYLYTDYKRCCKLLILLTFISLSQACSSTKPAVKSTVLLTQDKSMNTQARIIEPGEVFITVGQQPTTTARLAQDLNIQFVQGLVGVSKDDVLVQSAISGDG